MTTDELINAVREWGRSHKIDNALMQYCKTTEELSELAHEFTRGRQSGPEVIDALGDTTVCLIILADILGYDLIECLASAYDVIKDRKGHTDNGTFIKDTEKSYKIVAYGPGKELLTWSCSGDLDNIKKCLKADGYDEIKVMEEDGETS